MPGTEAGSVYLGVKLDSQQFNRQMAALAAEAQKIMQRAVSGTSMKLDTSAIEKSIDNVARSIDTLGDNLMSTFSRSMEKGATEGIKQTAKVVSSATFPKVKIEFSEERLKEQIALLGQKWKALDDQRMAQAQKVARLQAMTGYDLPGTKEAQVNVEKLAQARLRLADLKMAAAQTDAQVYALEQQLERLGQKGEEAPQRASESFVQMGYQAQRASYNASSAMSNMAVNSTSAFDRFKMGAKNLISRLKEMVLNMNIFQKSSKSGMSSLMKFSLMAMGIRSMYMLIRRLVNLIKDGFEDMGRQFSGFQEKLTRLKDGLGTLKASFAGMFAPVFEALLPMIETIISKLVSAFNTIGLFMARLFGQTTYRQVVGYNSAVEAGADAANASNAAHKKLFRTLAGFDELEILKGKDTLSGGGVSGGSTAGSPIYEEIAISPLGGSLTSLFNAWIENVNAASVGQWLSDKFIAATDWLIRTIGDINWRKLGDKVGEGWNAIDWAGVVKGLFNTIKTALGGIVDLLSGFIEKVDWVEFGNGIYKGLAAVDWADFASKVWRLIGGALGGAIGVLWGFLSGFANRIKIWWKENAYDENDEFDGNGLVKAIGRGILSVPESAYRGIIKPLTIGLANALGVEVSADTFDDQLKESFSSIGVRIATWLQEGMQNAFIGFLQWMDETIVPEIVRILNGIIDTINFFLRTIGQKEIPRITNFSLAGQYMTQMDASALGKLFEAYQTGGLSGFLSRAQTYAPSGGSTSQSGTNYSKPSGGIKATAFAAGGYVTQPTLATIGEQSKKEVVLPLERNTEWARLLANELRGAGGVGGGDIHITQPIYLGTDQLIGVIETVVDREGRLRNKPVFA